MDDPPPKVDNAGNVYVTGFSESDYLTLKYDPSGNQLWVARYNGPGNLDDGAGPPALDSAGIVYVSGFSQGDLVTVKYDSNGNELWVARYHCPSDGICFGGSLGVDSAGNVCVTGSCYTTNSCSADTDFMTLKYDPNGTRLWVSR